MPHSVTLSTFATIFDALNVVVYVSDLATHELLFVNGYTEKAFGTGWEGRRCYEYLQAGQAGPCAFCTNHLLVRDGEPQPPHVWELENTSNHRWYLCIDRAIPWSDGRLVRLETAVDITDRKELERFREQYVGLVSHDLRGPLHAIALAAQMLELSLAEKQLDREAAQVGRIQQTARRVENMIRDLLDTVRRDSEDAETHHEAVDLVALASGVVAGLPEEERGRVTIDAREPMVHALGDRAQLDRLLENLVGNALKHSPAGAPVVVEIARGDRGLLVSVVDEGPGIAAEHHERIFERFYRVPDVRARGMGLGLGLYIAKTIVERHRGRLRVESAPGRGSRFEVLLPPAP